MNRRNLIQCGAMAWVVGGKATVSLGWAASAVNYAQPIAAQLQEGMIWVQDSVPVPIAVGELSIAGNGNGSAAPPASDLHAVFWKEFPIAEMQSTAEVHLFAYTRYRLYVNGRYVARGPSRFQNQRPEYDTLEISQYLKKGRNTIVVLVHCDAPSGRIMNHAPGFAAVVTWKDRGAVARSVVTDESWRGVTEASFLPRRIAWASITENIDATRMVDWTAEDFDGKDWPKAVRVADDPTFFPLCPRTTPLQREIERTLMPEVSDPGRTIAGGEDFVAEVNQLIQGYHLLRFEADPGSVMEVQYLLPDGNSGSSSYIARGGVQTWMSGDTFAFTKLRVNVKSGRIALRQAQVFEVRYPFTRVGSFNSSDAMLNQLWSICARTLEMVSEDAYVDCSDRERVEWTDCTPPSYECTRVMMAGPDQDGAPTVWGDPRILKAMVQRIGLTQQPDGQIKAHSCSERWDVHAIMEDRSCDWVNAARQYYDSTGDKEFVRRMWPTLVWLIDWFLSKRTERGLVQAREWEVWDNPLRYQVCEGAGLNAFVYWALRDAAYLGLAAGPGSRADASRFAKGADELRDAFQTILWDEQAGSYVGACFGPGTQVDPTHNKEILKEMIVDGRFRPTLQAALFALESDIVPDGRRAKVKEFVLAHDGEATQVMSHFYLYRTFYGMDRVDLDLKVLESIRQKWMPQVESPWQTAWEGFIPGSKVHGYGMHPGYFLSSYVLGVRRDEPVWTKRIVIEPHLGDLKKAEGVVVTEHGPVTIAWAPGDNGNAAMTVNIPQGVRAEVRLRMDRESRNLRVDGHPVVGAMQGGRVVYTLGEGHHSVEQAGD